MYNGRHQSPRHAAPRYRKRRSVKPFVVFVSVLMLLVVAAVGTMAFIQDNTTSVENVFKPSEVNVAINEDTTANTKSNISFTNTKTVEDISAYIRATLAVYWTDVIDGVEVVIAQPKGASVTIGAPLSNWFKVGDIFYYALPVPPGETTSVMNGTNTVVLPEGSTAKCHIDVRAEAIQSVPASTVEEAWPVHVNSSGNLTP